VLDELDRGEVAHPVAGVDRGAAEPEEVVAPAGAGRPDETQIVVAVDPVERDEVVVAGRRIGDSARLNSSRVLSTGKRAPVIRLRCSIRRGRRSPG
jgi:hypothetical protein